MKNSRGTGIFLSYGYTFINMLCGLVMSSYLLRMLGDTEYGLYQTVSSFATYLVMLQFGTGTAMSRNILKYKNAGDPEGVRKSVSTVMYISVFLSLVIAALAAVFCVNIDNIYSATMTAPQAAYAKKIFVLVVVLLLASFFTQVGNGILLGYENYTFGQTASLVKVLLRTLLLTAVIWFSRHAIFIALIDMSLELLIFFTTIIYCRKKYKIAFNPRDFDKNILKESLPLCLALMIQTVVNQANNNVDKFVIGISMSMESVAIYSVAQYVYTMFSSVTTIPITMYMPQVAKDLQRGLDDKGFTKTLIRPCRLVTLLGGTVLCGFFAVGKQFISIVYGAGKAETWLYALIIMAPMFVNMTNGVIVNVLDMKNKRLVRSLTLLGTTALNIVLTVILISKMGIIGAVIATAVATIIGQDILMNVYYAKKLGIKVTYLFYRAYKGILPVLTVSGLIAFFAARAIGNVWLSFFAGGVLFVALAAVGMVLFGLDGRERSELKSRAAALRGKFKIRR